MHFTRILLGLCVFVSAAPAFGLERIPIINRTEQQIDVWIWKRDENQWVRPVLTIPPKETGFVDFTGKLYYLAVKPRTPEPQISAIGWIDPTALKRRSPSASIVLDGVIQTAVKEVPQTIMKPVWETRTRQVPVTRWFCINGRWCRKTELIDETYRIRIDVPEQCVKTSTVDTIVLTPSIQDANGPLMCQVTFKTEKPGAFIRYQLIGRSVPSLAKNPTVSAEVLPVGRYYIWAVRDGEATSRREIYDLVRETDEITIPEMKSTP